MYPKYFAETSNIIRSLICYIFEVVCVVCCSIGQSTKINQSINLSVNQGQKWPIFAGLLELANYPVSSAFVIILAAKRPLQGKSPPGGRRLFAVGGGGGGAVRPRGVIMRSNRGRQKGSPRRADTMRSNRGRHERAPRPASVLCPPPPRPPPLNNQNPHLCGVLQQYTLVHVVRPQPTLLPCLHPSKLRSKAVCTSILAVFGMSLLPQASQG